MFTIITRQTLHKSCRMILFSNYDIKKTFILLLYVFSEIIKTSQKICFANFLDLKIHHKHIYCTYVYMYTSMTNLDSWFYRVAFLHKLKGQTKWKTNGQTDRQTVNLLTDRQTDGWTDGQTDRMTQTDTETDKRTFVLSDEII